MDETRTRMGFRAQTGAYLLVVRDESSFMFHLPPSGAVTIGRAADVELQVDHGSVSRRHATVRIEDGVVSIVDLGSHNGTRVNGELLREARVLASGDVATVGDVVCVVHIESRSARAHVVHAEGPWRRRLAEELARASEHGRTLGVLAITGADVTAVSPSLRVIDVLGTGASGDTLVVIPEASRAEVRAAAARIHAATPAAAIGMAMCPEDANDVDTALYAARAAAKRAAVGTLVEARDTVTRLAFGALEGIAADPAMLKLYALIERLAPSPLPVLILGETGAGKEYAAAAVHHGSKRSGRLVAVNCAAIPAQLFESELFGHVKGAFTGATADKPGLFAAADGGTLYFDEIAELPLEVQPKLLRVLETRRVMRVGETTERPVDVRIVAATLTNLEDAVAAGRFRNDLLFRIAGATVVVPPLRDRRVEIPVLARELLGRECVRSGRAPIEITPGAMQALLAHAWPGNVRQLALTMMRLAALVPDDRLEREDVLEAIGEPLPEPPEPPRAANAADGPFRPIADELRELEIRRMTEALAATGGVKTKAAALIAMPIRTFNFKLRQYKL